MNDKISFLVPVSNNEKDYYKSIRSILNQSYKNFEILIGLNGNSKNFENKFKKKFESSKRIKIFKLSKKNIVLTLNFLINKSRGKFLARFDVDDICFKNRIKTQLEYIKKNKIDLLSSNCEVFINKKFSYNHKTDFSKLAYTNPIIHPTIIAKKELFKKFNYNNIPYAEDYEFYLRLYLESKKFVNMPERLIKYNLNLKNIGNKKKSFLLLLSTLIVSKGFRDRLKVNPKFFIKIKYDKNFYISYEKFYKTIILNKSNLLRIFFGLFHLIFGHRLIKKNILNYLFYRIKINKNLNKKKKIIKKLNHYPLVSFVIPTFNSEHSIVRTLKSVLNQTYSNIEVIIVDNSPNNKTLDQISKNFKNRKKIKIVKVKKYIMPAEARNIGVKNSNKFTKFISFCDSDDILKKDKTQIQIRKMLEEDAKVSCTNADFYDVKNKVINKNYFNYPFLTLNFKDLCFKNVIITSSVIVSKKLFLSVNGFSESNYFYSFEDYFLWLKIALKSNISFFDESLLIYNDNRSVSASSKSRHIINQRLRILLYFFIRTEIKKTLSIISGNSKLLNNWIQKKFFNIKQNEYINLL